MAARRDPDPRKVGAVIAHGWQASLAAGRENNAEVRQRIREGRAALSALEAKHGRDHPAVKEARQSLRASSRMAARAGRSRTRGASSRNAKSKKASSSYAGG